MSVYKETGASYLTRTKGYWKSWKKWCRPSKELYPVCTLLPDSHSGPDFNGGSGVVPAGEA